MTLKAVFVLSKPCPSIIWQSNRSHEASSQKDRKRKWVRISEKMRIFHEANKNKKILPFSSVVLVPEESEDMWHAYNIIAPGDVVRASTIRKVSEWLLTDDIPTEDDSSPGPKRNSNWKQQQQPSPHYADHQSGDDWLRYSSMHAAVERQEHRRKSIR